MIDFWIFPLSTIWGAYHFQGFGDFLSTRFVHPQSCLKKD